MPLLKNTLLEYPNRLFIETGTLHCDGIRRAIESGFKQVISIELAPHYYLSAFYKYAYHPYVKIIQGDSSVVLSKVLEHVDEQVTFWLDGHYSAGDTALGEVNSPLMLELDIIKQHHVKTHTILIDDLRCWTNPEGMFDKSDLRSNKFDTEVIVNKLKEINADYMFDYRDGHIPNDILVAHI